MNEQDNLGMLNIDTSLYKTRISTRFAARKPYQPVNPCIISGFIPGTVLEILVVIGQGVKKGDAMIILDAMKMQNIIRCTIDGRVKRIEVKKGDKVSKGRLLLEIE